MTEHDSNQVNFWHLIVDIAHLPALKNFQVDPSISNILHYDDHLGPFPKPVNISGRYRVPGEGKALP